MFTLIIGTPYLPTIPVLNFEIVHSNTCCVKTIAVCLAISEDPDQMPHSVSSDFGLHSLQRPFCPSI